MSTTTQILFNSPALHSLKRDQLVKLCKIHSIKASGKNTELIEKLKKHAETLPRDSPLSVAARSEEPPGEDTQMNEGEEGEGPATNEDQSQSSNARWGFQMPRPSEQWEVVMESIDEMDEQSSQGTLNSLRTLGSNNGGSSEFGTGMSKSSSVSSSIKALASSLGLKRGNTSKSTLTPSSSFTSSFSSKSGLNMSSHPLKNDELVQHSVPYSSLPESDNLPQSDHFTFDHPMESAEGYQASEAPPLPGQSLRPGIPAPANARLSLGLNAPATPTRGQPITTIRLISNPILNDDSYGRTPQLKPFQTSFDLEIGSPQLTTGGFSGVSLWPDIGVAGSRIYPPLPLEDLALPTHTVVDNIVAGKDAPMPGSFSSAPMHAPPTRLTPAPVTPTTVQLAVPEPFIFGSPLPQHCVSNAQFKSAAASVLEEMNNRLKQDGVDGIGMDLISRLQPGAHTQGAGVLIPREAKGTPKASRVKEKFDEIHAEEFNKMEGIDSLVKRRGMVAKRESTAVPAKKRKSSMGVGRDRFGRRVGGESGRISATRVISGGRRPRVIPGSFGDDDSDEEDESNSHDAAKGAGDEPIAMVDTNSRDDAKAKEEEKEKAAEEQKQKEREAIRRKLEKTKAKRRSSVAGARGRVSVGRGGVLHKPQPPPKPSRFGFLSSAKSLVQKVWGGGKAATTLSTATASIIPKPAGKIPVPTKTIPAPAPAPTSKTAPAAHPARPSSAINASVSRVGSLRTDKDKATVGTNFSRARSPLPSFVPTSSSTRSSLVQRTRTSSITSVNGGAGISSIGTRSSVASSSKGASLSGIGSMGSKKLLGGLGRASGTTAAATGSSSSRVSSRLSSSRLLAPTASSLAKTARPSASGSKSSLKSVAEGSGSQKSQGGETLGMITNSPGAAKEPWSPRPGGIFSRPFTMPSGIPTPAKKRPESSLSSDPSDQSGNGDGSKNMKSNAVGVPPLRQRSIIGRKPRISRSKVIAKLASQRAAGSGVSGPASGTPSSRGAGRTRSSMGAKVQRSSFSGKAGGSRASGEGIMMSAKKRARQSEYSRRKSRVAPIDFGPSASAQGMDVAVV